MRRSHATPRRRNLAGSLPYRKLAVSTTGTNGVQHNKIRIVLCFSRVPVYRVTIFSRKPENGMSSCGSPTSVH
jgi:hypothetical protein